MPIRPLRRSRASSRALFGIGFRPERRVLISELISQLEVYLDNDAVSEVYRAYVFAAEAHEGQTRISGEPYIYHPLAVAQLLAEKQLDSKSISAAILHDIIEDTPTAKEQIATEFGEDIALLVDGVSKITQIEFESKEHAEAENIRKMLLAMSQDIRVILIKLADRLHNMRTLESLPVEKQKRIARQTLEIFAAIANRLGVYSWSRELEEISFQTIYPKRYDALAKALRRRESHRRSGMKKLLAVMETHLKEGDVNAQVVSREKDIFSIYRKMQRKRMSFEEIQDIYGFRIIVNNSDDCYRVLGRIHGLYKPIPGRFKDYIAIPKANGYQSLHTTVFGAFGESLEVQIRTEEMNRIAEAGIAAHWVYKSDDITGKQSQAQARQWLLDLLDTQKQVANPSEFLEHLKVDLFPDKIYVFTPKGDIKKFPQGATALDFAYAIHSDVGNRCVGARFNQQLVPLHTRLRNGDHVEVTTSRSALPTPSWLSYATTSKARTAIRGNLKKQRRKDSVRLGRKLLDRAVKTLGTTSRRVSPTRRQQLLQTLHLEEWDELLMDIGLGKRLPLICARQLVYGPQGTSDGEEFELQSMAIEGVEGMMVSYAKCCRPIPGDAIAGFLTTGRGIVVHILDCTNIASFKNQPEKWLPLHWAEKVSGQYAVLLRVHVENRPGVFARLATVIAEQNSNILEVSVVEREGLDQTISFIIEVSDRKHLAQIMWELRQTKRVMRLFRAKG